ncbi:glycosyltransferase family 2 protein [Pedobacter sp. PLR]|uniref:glycosyltransferase family 2 protein n=1 Tax=Pedobacter sp. PLR TaxID=2994465 RepID=UPI002247A8CD|nr:glycosyltransferase family 2 protein [Pedobacter sp. PLR]MCX2450388.1 glycosyltransferase family 2 protein [Pedobacter sp. PLR]
MTYSIIVPTYNSEKTLSACLVSIMNQKCSDFEIIISDGVSTDSTLAIARGFNDERIKIYTAPDAGIYDAMNKSITRANGDWLLFLGSDDLLFNDDVLENVKNHLALTEAAFVYGDVKMVGDTPWAKDGTLYKGETTVSGLFDANICHQAIFYARKIFVDRKVGYNLNYKVCADYDLNLFCASRYPIQYVPETVSYFNSGGMSSVVPDAVFNREKWLNIVYYFREKLFDENLASRTKELKKTWKRFFKRFQVSLAILAFRIYIYHRFKKPA